MGKLIFYIVDVFAEEKYAGNQLAVVRDATALSDSQMQKITKEMNYSETTFIMSEEPREGGYDVRIFTPAAEVPFAGHPTLGTAFVIRQEIVKQPIETINLNLKVGQIPVTFEREKNRNELLWMKQIEPVFGQNIEAGVIAQILGLERSEIDERFPIEEVSTGLPHIIVPLKNLDAVGRSIIAKDKYFKLVNDRWAKAILIFCPQTSCRENALRVRVFGDYYGVPEDPATGSGNGCLAGYLVKHRYFGTSKIDIRVEQGHEIGRPSLLYLRAEEKSDHIDVSVGGKVIMIAEGKLF
ncbi:MAG: phenazine biosynthesis protein [Planctomycetes bacterium RBG_13_46_10]|nr:MAG: phenazine biosynthesis protein [Planctomycetes bacterium RBG_13_46_10]